MLIQFVIGIISFIFGILSLITILGLLFIALNIILSLAALAFRIFVIVPGITITIRRLHDTDKSAWWLLFYAILYFVLVMVGVIIVFMAFASQGYGVGGGLFIGAIIYWIIAVLVLLGKLPKGQT